jgi:O-antigen ligase/polysaccharide polymerase Wzy-like membrane protein
MISGSSAKSRFNEGLALMGLLALLMAAGVASVSRPLVIPAALALVGCAAIVARGGLRGTTLLLVGLLPWLVVFNDLLPSLTRTMASAAAALAVLLLSRSENGRARMQIALLTGVACFVFPILFGVLREPGNDQVTLAAKLLVFPLVAITIATGRLTAQSQRLLSLVIIVSGTVALATQIAIGEAGIGQIGTTYNSGEILGYAVPHDVALVGVIVASGALFVSMQTKWRVLVFSVASTAVVFTGVRAGILAILIVVIASLFQSGARFRTIAVLGIAMAVAFGLGADKVIENRVKRGYQIGEFSSIAQYGSGRVNIYRVALDGYASSPGALDWAMGTGLRSIPRFEVAATGSAFQGHSDLIEAAVELGPLGLIGFVMIWVSLFRTVASRLPLIGLLVFGVVNGSLEYTAGVVLALVLAGVAAERIRGPTAGAAPQEAAGNPHLL